MTFRASMVLGLTAALALAACATGSGGGLGEGGGGGGGSSTNACESADEYYADCTGQDVAPYEGSCDGETLCVSECIAAASCDQINALLAGDAAAAGALNDCLLVCQGGSSCDNSGVCQDSLDSEAGCSPCALDTVCKAELEACGADAECVAYNDCIQPCEDEACFQSCDAQYPAGAEGFLALASCVICQACPNDCDAASSCQ